MPVVTQYVVVRDGEEKMTFNSKAEAEADYARRTGGSI